MPLKKGQKLTDNPRSIRQEVRLTKSEYEMLQECADEMQLTKTEVIVKGIEKVSEEIKKK